MNVKELMVNNLTLLRTKYKSIDKFKERAYKNALDNLPEDIHTFDDVKSVGGAKIQQKLKFIFEHRKNLDEVEQILNDDKYDIIESLQKVHGIGPSKAIDLYENQSIKSVNELRENKHLLNNIQLKGLKYYDDINKKIPYTEMVKHETFLKKTLNDIELYITGSFRRKCKSSSDIDVLISGKTNMLPYVREVLIKSQYLIEEGIFADGQVKIMAMCKLPKHKHLRRIDILYTIPKELPFALLYFTGNYKFNVNMRKHALQNGYTLNEQGLYDIHTKERVSVSFLTEKDIFKFLNYTYIEPENRLH